MMVSFEGYSDGGISLQGFVQASISSPQSLSTHIEESLSCCANGFIKINANVDLTPKASLGGIGFVFQNRQVTSVRAMSELLRFNLAKIGKTLAIRYAKVYHLDELKGLPFRPVCSVKLRMPHSSEALRIVFPLLNGTDLVSCMLVCKQWRDIGEEDYFWKCLCVKHWPSICKSSTPLPRSYRELFQMFSKRCRPRLHSCPILSFDDLDFYIDIWDEEKIVFSEVIPGSFLQGGTKDLPPRVSERHKNYLNSSHYKMIIPVDPKFCIFSETVSVSILICRKDTNKMAYIFQKSKLILLYEGYPSNNLDFGSPIEEISGFLPWVYLLFIVDEDDGPVVNVFGIGLDFGRDAASEFGVLSLLQMIDWG
ncbi:hypothetical protein NE237_020743 [Protea cynaroides]|uniref:F-box domain-containing protein n=1 Tax=Protea cynaroides TaxID=273540 RepID=A0A9Q0H9T1_9MAGN|nr:hypothetical protein NE237_020743 [Protea cynaroides]